MNACLLELVVLGCELRFFADKLKLAMRFDQVSGQRMKCNYFAQIEW